MGSSSSRLGPRPFRPRVNRLRRGLSSLLCGGSSSRAPPETEDYPAETLLNSVEHCRMLVDEFRSSPKEFFSLSSSGTSFTSLKPETGASSASSSAASEEISFGNVSRNIETSNQEMCFYESKDSVSPHLLNSERNSVGSRQDTASTSYKEQCSPDSVSVNVRANLAAVNNNDNLVNGSVSQLFPELMHPSSSSPQELSDSCSDGACVGNHACEVVTNNSDSGTVQVVSDSSVAFQSRRDESVQDTIASGLEFLVSDRDQGRRDGSVLHVDLVSISSNILSSSTAEISNRDARRNSRRLFWDAFSRRNSRRHSDTPTIVFSMDGSDGVGSHDRWLLDLSGEFFDDGVGGDSRYLSSSVHSMNERRWHSRSEIWERLRGGLDENGRRTTLCPTGLHPQGTCSCEPFLMTEESGTRASISRIVMLAEALFEVLDEIHRQPVSLSLSMVSLPAPESLVDSFPLKNHKRIATTKPGADVEQCYICLAEYEDGDKIRILPCHHEYHMSCVDKWLKEIHGVCPLCRGDVRDGIPNASVSNSENSSFL